VRRHLVLALARRLFQLPSVARRLQSGELTDPRAIASNVSTHDNPSQH